MRLHEVMVRAGRRQLDEVQADAPPRGALARAEGIGCRQAGWSAVTCWQVGDVRMYSSTVAGKTRDTSIEQPLQRLRQPPALAGPVCQL